MGFGLFQKAEIKDIPCSVIALNRFSKSLPKVKSRAEEIDAQINRSQEAALDY